MNNNTNDNGADSGAPPFEESCAPLISPEQLDSWIIAEDDHIFAVNKPGDIVCHPSKNGPWSSLVGACRERLGLETVHLLHRLDRETSGLVLMAKDRGCASVAQMAFQERQVSRKYVAIMEGELPEKITVKKHLARDMDSPVYIKQTVRKSRSSQSAETDFEPVYYGNGYTLAFVFPRTGRKHQIRAHALWLERPIVADKIYGPDDTLYLEFIEHGWTDRLERALPLRRQALHAFSLEFHTPGFERMFMAPMADDMVQFARNRMGLSDPVGFLAEIDAGRKSGLQE